MVEYSPCAFEKAAVEGFSDSVVLQSVDSVVLRSVMSSETSLSSFLLEELSEIVAGILTAVI